MRGTEGGSRDLENLARRFFRGADTLRVGDGWTIAAAEIRVAQAHQREREQNSKRRHGRARRKFFRRKDFSPRKLRSGVLTGPAFKSPDNKDLPAFGIKRGQVLLNTAC